MIIFDGSSEHVAHVKRYSYLSRALLTSTAVPFLKIKSTCSGNCLDAACSATRTSLCDKTERGNDTIEDVCLNENENEPLVNGCDAALFYSVFSMRGLDSPDKARYVLEDALDTLSFEFREYPTLPSDSCEKTKAVVGALDKDKALVLPLKHCAFMYCSWCGSDDADLIEHLLSDHVDLLRPCMDAFIHL